MRRFELIAGKSKKFWAIRRTGASLQTQWGRIGTQGSGQNKTFKSEKDAEVAEARSIREKVGKGYLEVGHARHAKKAPTPAGHSRARPAKVKAKKRPAARPRHPGRQIEKLIQAALEGDHASALLLLGAGCDPNAHARGDHLALHTAAAAGDEKMVEILLSAGADPSLMTRDGNGPAAIHSAIGHFGLVSSVANAAIVRRLVAAGAPIDVRNEYGSSALHLAVAAHRVEETTALLALGADVNARDHHGSTPLMMVHRPTWLVPEPSGQKTAADRAYDKKVARRGDRIRALLRRSGATKIGLERVEIFRAVEEDDLTRVQRFLKAGLDPNEHCFGQSLLLAASLAGHDAIAHALLDAGADPNGPRGAEDRTPLLASAELGDLKLVEMLLAAGADPKARSMSIGSAIDHAHYGYLSQRLPNRPWRAVVALLRTFRVPVFKKRPAQAFDHDVLGTLSS